MSDSSEVSQIRAWMRAVMEEKEWSAEHWARLAGTSPTNITRFLKDGDHTPSMKTVVKLSRVAGSMPQIGQNFVRVAPREIAVPLYDRECLLRIASDQKPSTPKGGKVVSTMCAVSEQAFALEVTDQGGPWADVKAGDVIILEPVLVQQPRPGDLVLFLDPVSELFELGHFHAPLLVRGTNTPARVADIKIVAVVIEVRRLMRPAGAQISLGNARHETARKHKH